MIRGKRRIRGGAIDAVLRAVVNDGDDPSALVALGRPAFERLLALIDGRVPISCSIDFRDYEANMSDALTAFARQDVEAVLEALEARGWDESSTAVWALGNVSSPRVVPFLERALASRHAHIRWMAVCGLARQKGRPTTDALIRALRDRSSHVRAVAAEALGKKNASRALEALRAAAAAKSNARYPPVARYAQQAIARILKR